MCLVHATATVTVTVAAAALAEACGKHNAKAYQSSYTKIDSKLMGK